MQSGPERDKPVSLAGAGNDQVHKTMVNLLGGERESGRPQ